MSKTMVIIRFAMKETWRNSNSSQVCHSKTTRPTAGIPKSENHWSQPHSSDTINSAKCCDHTRQQPQMSKPTLQKKCATQLSQTPPSETTSLFVASNKQWRKQVCAKSCSGIGKFRLARPSSNATSQASQSKSFLCTVVERMQRRLFAVERMETASSWTPDALWIISMLWLR